MTIRTQTIHFYTFSLLSSVRQYARFSAQCDANRPGVYDEDSRAYEFYDCRVWHSLMQSVIVCVQKLTQQRMLIDHHVTPVLSDDCFTLNCVYRLALALRSQRKISTNTGRDEWTKQGSRDAPLTHWSLLFVIIYTSVWSIAPYTTAIWWIKSNEWVYLLLLNTFNIR